MFCLDRAEFPVDTHVWHIAKRLNWVPERADREATYLHLNTRVPDRLKYDLHVLLVDHGKRCTSCAKGGRLIKPEEGKCPLVRARGGRGGGETASPFTKEEEPAKEEAKADVVKEEVTNMETKVGPAKRKLGVEVKEEMTNKETKVGPAKPTEKELIALCRLTVRNNLKEDFSPLNSSSFDGDYVA